MNQSIAANSLLIISILSLSSFHCSVGQEAKAPSAPLPSAAVVAAAEAGITEDSFRGHIQFLADDLLEGRGPGTRGDELAQRYIISQFRELGLQPAAGNGSWTQDVPLLGVTTRPPANMTFKTGEKSLELKNYEDYIVTCGTGAEETTITDAEVVFVGYGMQAPEFKWDDFKDVDVRGKLLLVMNNDPANNPELFAGRTRLYYGRWDYKYAKAAEMGAIGALIIHTDESAGYPYQVVQTSWTGEQMALGGPQTNRAAVEGWLTEDASKKLVARAGFDLDELRKSAESPEFKPVPLGTTLSTSLKCLARERKSANVLGVSSAPVPHVTM